MADHETSEVILVENNSIKVALEVTPPQPLEQSMSTR